MNSLWKSWLIFFVLNSVDALEKVVKSQNSSRDKTLDICDWTLFTKLVMYYNSLQPSLESFNVD